MRIVIAAMAACGVASSAASAVPTLDGFRDGAYGAAKAVQGVETQFAGSELDAAYAIVQGGTLHLMITGNLESTFTRLNIFIDSFAGGQNVLQNDANNGGTNPENDNWALNHAGFTFDDGFEADYMLIARNGNSGGDRFDLDFATLGGGLGAFLTSGPAFGAALMGANPNALPNGIGVAFDNSNTEGVMPGIGGAADGFAALAVTTGIELTIPLSVIGNPTGEIKISAMLNGPFQNFVSNQFLGSLTPTQGNLGGDVGLIDLNLYDQLQYFVVEVPSPAGASLLAVASGVAVRRRRG